MAIVVVSPLVVGSLTIFLNFYFEFNAMLHIHSWDSFGSKKQTK